MDYDSLIKVSTLSRMMSILWIFLGLLILSTNGQTGTKACPPLSGIKYGTVETTTDRSGKMARYRCYYGYQLIGQAIHRCHHGKWLEANVPKCVQIYCAALPYIAHGSWKVEGDEEGQRAIMKCEEGYELTAKTDFVMCKRNGEILYWHGETPACQVLQPSGCRLPSAMKGAKLLSEKKEMYDPGEYVEIECDVGYRAAEGSLHVVCDDKGQWDDVFPECQIIKCKRPEMPANGNISPLEHTDDQEFPFAFEIAYSCAQGHELVGPKYRLCDVEGWSGQEPFCKLVVCEGTPMLDRGRVVSNRKEMKYYPGEGLSVICDIGYMHTTEEHQVICTHDGVWKNMAVCSQITCGYPELPAHALLREGSTKKGSRKFSFGDVVTYSCQQGFLLQGPRERICEKNGWSGKNPLCLEITCSPPEIPNDGYLIERKSEYKYNETATYNCKPRFGMWGGSRTRTCTELEWTGNVPQCRVLGCESLVIPNGRLLRGYKNRFGYYNVGLRTTVSCDPNYRLSGTSTFVYCNRDGEWKGSVPSCIEVTCPGVNHEMLNPADKETVYVPGSKLSISCPDKFHPIDGSTTITCLTGGKWSDSLANCHAESCPEPPQIDNGEVIHLFETKEVKYTPTRTKP